MISQIVISRPAEEAEFLRSQTVTLETGGGQHLLEAVGTEERNVEVEGARAKRGCVSTKALNQAVKRNPGRFPSDFRFKLTNAERDEVVTICDHLGRLRFSTTLPWAFTEHGAIMAASVLNSSRAVEMSVFVVRAFVRLRDFARGDAELAARLRQLERRVGGHDQELAEILAAIRQLSSPLARPRRAANGFTHGGGR